MLQRCMNNHHSDLVIVVALLIKPIDVVICSISHFISISGLNAMYAGNYSIITTYVHVNVLNKYKTNSLQINAL